MGTGGRLGGAACRKIEHMPHLSGTAPPHAGLRFPEPARRFAGRAGGARASLRGERMLQSPQQPGWAGRARRETSMVTLDEVYAKIVADDAEKRAFAEAFATEEGAAAFMERHGCDAKPAELVAFLKKKACEAGEVPDGELEGVGGGAWGDWVLSLCSLGGACILAVTWSAILETEESKKRPPSEDITMCQP